MADERYYQPYSTDEELKRIDFEKEFVDLEDINYDLNVESIILDCSAAFSRCLKFDEVRNNSELLEYFYRNQWFGAFSALVAYTVVRFFKPRKIIEIGSGYSTLLLLEALKDLESDSSLDSIDPSDKSEFDFYSRERFGCHYQGFIQDIKLEYFEKLEGNDILFVDTTHCSRTGGDVNYIIFNILPRLRPGVLIHFHDIFLPYEYPKEWLIDKKRGWNEQYLLMAFLYGNLDFEVIFLETNVVKNLKKNTKERFHEKFFKFENNYYSSSCWLRKIR